MHNGEKTEFLDIKLEQYAKSDYYPFHMPGHKRVPFHMPDPYTIDITEIDGFDNLHAPEGILLQAQKRAAALYGADRSYYLINGSTCGILAAISAAVPPKKTLLMARNVHKSVYHAVYLRGLKTEYLNPYMTGFGIFGAVCADEVRRKLEQNSDIAAVIITSPTYEGIVSDVAKIAETAHAFHVPLIVDEAHGAHFGMYDAFPQTAVRAGADVVIQSMHKVLPSLTQTALLHLRSDLIQPESIERFLDIYETSSPSYVLMAGMEKCIRLLDQDKENLFEEFYKKLEWFYKKTENLKHIHIMKKEDFSDAEQYDLDPSKIVISVRHTTMSGSRLYEVLLNKYHLQMEMVSGFYVLAMTSIMDRMEGFERLYEALAEIDASISTQEEDDITEFIRQFYTPREKRSELYEAMELPVTAIPFDEAEGKISGSYVYLYPPGIPVLIPGEIIDKSCIENIRKSIKLRLNLQGIADIINERINVVNF